MVWSPGAVSVTFHNVIDFQCYSLYFITLLVRYTEVKYQLTQFFTYIVPWKTTYLNIFYLSLSISCTFKVTLVVFADVFEEYYIFAIIMDPFQTSFLAPFLNMTYIEKKS